MATQAPSDELGAVLEWTFVRVKRYLARYGHRLVQASGTLNNLYVSLLEAQALLGASPFDAGEGSRVALTGLPDLSTVDAELARLEPPWMQSSGRLAELTRRFGLETVDIALLAAAISPLVSVDLARFYTFAWADFALKKPSVGFLCELVAQGPAEALALHDRFHPDAPLIGGRLLRIDDVPAWGEATPALHAAVSVPASVIAFIRNQPLHLSGPLALACHRGDSTADVPERLRVPERVRTDVHRWIGEALQSDCGRPRLVLVGSRGTGRRSVVARALADQGGHLLLVDLDRLPTEAPEVLAGAVADACREAMLRRSLLLLRGEEIFDQTGVWDRLRVALAPTFERHRGPVAVAARRAVRGLHEILPDAVEIGFPLPSASDQRQAWADVLSGIDLPFDADLPGALTRRFSVSPGTIRRAATEAVTHARLKPGDDAPPTLTVDDIARAIRRRVSHALGAVAEPFSTTLSWEDVVLPAEVVEPLQALLSQARHREKVYDEWGFRQKMSYGRGLSALFLGPPGTGKTMMSAIVAQSLGRELYRVDLSRVVSKWVGETEKNLARVFDEAEKAQVILLFDEADSLFSSRTEVKGANDRFANMEINYLLQRMEAYDGMSILTTNFEKGIDEAFKRRLKFRIYFPMPEVEERTLLWERMIPPQAVVAEGIRFAVLGKKYKLAGGNIKNAVLRAAFYAAEGDGVITHALLDRAAVAESREMGRLI